METKPPAQPQELNADFVCYRRAVSGTSVDDTDRNAYGQTQYTYVKRRGFKAKVMRQRTNSLQIENQNVVTYAETAVTNWWDCKEFKPTDVLLRCNDRKQFVIDGGVVNWQNRNRWGLLPLVAENQCLDGIDSCNCEQAETAPEGTADQDQNLEAP